MRGRKESGGKLLNYCKFQLIMLGVINTKIQLYKAQ